MVWRYGGRSVRGIGHFVSGQPCQDACWFNAVAGGDVFIACVADGGGSVPLSHFGSRIACAVATGAMALLSRRFHEMDNEAMAAFWRDLAADARTAIEAEAASLNRPIGDFGTTLLAAMATPDRVSMMQVGDGFIVVSPSDADPASRYTLAFEPRRGDYVGEVTWITSSDWEKDFQTRIITGRQDFLCLSSDGLEKVAILQQTQTPHAGYFDYMRDRVAAGSTSADMDELVGSVLLNPALDTRTDDDKSLVLARWFG
jgi:serine/threonine protein phosphatase PrpC